MFIKAVVWHKHRVDSPASLGPKYLMEEEKKSFLYSVPNALCESALHF